MEPIGPVIFIAGQTASGKTDLATLLAKKYRGEVICADSRTIYKKMDIGTAKPTFKEMDGVKHHGINLIDPNENYSAADFKDYAGKKITEINSIGKIPFIVGGSGLYIDGLLYNYSFSPKTDEVLRRELELKSLSELADMATEKGISESEVNFKNKRHLIRSIERGGVISQPKIKKDSYLILAPFIDGEELNARIESRIEKMLEEGFVDEVEHLISQYGVNAPGLLAPGYKAFASYIKGEISYSEAKDEFMRADKNLAKRQKTWFKRNKDIIWVKNSTEAEIEVENFLAKFDTILT